MLDIKEALKTQLMERADYDVEECLINILIDNIEGMDVEEAKYYLENDAYPSNGAVSGLIYYNETEEIFKKHFTEILEILEDYRNDVGDVSFELSANNIVWFTWQLFKGKWEVKIDWEELEEEEEV